MGNIPYKQLYMTQIWFDVRRLVELARALHLPIYRVDHNYIVHCAMNELVGNEIAPKPFCVEENNGRNIRVLGYSDADSDMLHETAKLKASPLVYECCDWDRTASKPLPTQFAEETVLKFELRVCPVVRKSDRSSAKGAGKEVDAFLSRVWEIDDPEVKIDREEVYRQWLNKRFEISGAAETDGVVMERFSLERMMRRTQGGNRKTRTIKRPDVTLTGRVRVKNSQKFMELVRNGIGRHKSFGYGMLKLRP